jgi:hypothetical protein
LDNSQTGFVNYYEWDLIFSRTQPDLKLRNQQAVQENFTGSNGSPENAYCFDFDETNRSKNWNGVMNYEKLMENILALTAGYIRVKDYIKKACSARPIEIWNLADGKNERESVSVGALFRAIMSLLGDTPESDPFYGSPPVSMYQDGTTKTWDGDFTLEEKSMRTSHIRGFLKYIDVTESGIITKTQWDEAFCEEQAHGCVKTYKNLKEKYKKWMPIKVRIPNGPGGKEIFKVDGKIVTSEQFNSVLPNYKNFVGYRLEPAFKKFFGLKDKTNTRAKVSWQDFGVEFGANFRSHEKELKDLIPSESGGKFLELSKLDPEIYYKVITMGLAVCDKCQLLKDACDKLKSEMPNPPSGPTSIPDYKNLCGVSRADHWKNSKPNLLTPNDPTTFASP